MDTIRLVESLWTDLRYATRTLAGHRTFTAVAVLTLALEIGVNTAIFALLDAVVVRPVPVERPDELVIFGADNGRGSRLCPQAPEGRPRVIGNRKTSVPSSIAKSPDVHPDQGRENTKREEFLVVVPMHDEGLGSVKDVLRRPTASRVPNSIRLRRDPQLCSERSLGESKPLSTLAEGRGGHGTPTAPSTVGTWQENGRLAYFRQLICAADRSSRVGAHLRTPPTTVAKPGERPLSHGGGIGTPGRARTCDPRLRRPMLYPAELRARIGGSCASSSHTPNGPARPKRA